jgi:hypothetical protein
MTIATPTEREVLDLLAEAGEEDLPILLNTLRRRHPAEPPPEQPSSPSRTPAAACSTP